MRRSFCLLPLVAVLWTAGALTAPPPARADNGWQWPFPPPVEVVRGFAPPAHDWQAGHRGVDLSGHLGEQVVAAGTGIVSFAGRVGSAWVVAIQHPNGLETTYEPVRALVRVGTEISAGTVLGVLLHVGSHCAPRACLHWGLRRSGTYLDPLALVGKVRVRLLPMLSNGGDGSWLTPAVSGASVGSSAVAVSWAGVTLRRRRRRLPPGVVSLASVRRERQRCG